MVSVKSIDSIILWLVFRFPLWGHFFRLHLTGVNTRMLNRRALLKEDKMELKASDILKGDGNGMMMVGILAVQKILKTLKRYKDDNERLKGVVKDKEAELECAFSMLETQRRESMELARKLKEVEETRLALRLVDSIRIDI